MAAARRVACIMLASLALLLVAFPVPGAWADYTEVQAITSSFNQFGTASACTPEGSVYVVGAPGAGTGSRVSVLVRQASGQYQEVQVLQPTVASSLPAGFGRSVAITPNALHILVGAPTTTAPASQEGRAYLFSRASTADMFSLKHVLVSTAAGLVGANFGSSVAISADALHALVSAPQMATSGRVLVFSRATTNDDLTQTQVLQGTSGTTVSRFGRSVAFTPNGLYAVVGTLSSQAFEFARTSTALSLTQRQELVPSPSGGGFGASVAITDDALCVLIGAPGVSSSQGRAFTFTRAAASDTLAQAQVLQGSMTPSFAFFGSSVAMIPDGSSAVVGAAGLSGPFTGVVGRAFVFARSSGTLSEVKMLQGSTAMSSFDEFGRSVAITADASRVFAGARSNQAFVFEVTAPAGTVTVTTQPSSTSVAAGSSASFTVAASPAGMFSVQWQMALPMTMSFSDIAGATSATLTVSTSTSGAEQGRQYRAIVTGSVNTVTSSVATLTLTGSPPTISTQPTNAAVTVGQSATFSVASSDTLTYQWSVDTATAAKRRRQARVMTPIMGATSSSFSTGPTTAGMNGYTYQVTLTNAFGSFSSSIVTLTVSAAASLAGDPHVRGLQGEVFDFDGAAGRVYNLLSHPTVHVNALLGLVPTDHQGLNLPGHWITDIGLVTRCVTIAVSAGRPINSLEPSIVVSRRDRPQAASDGAQGECDAVEPSSQELRASLIDQPPTAAAATMPAAVSRSRRMAWREADRETGDAVDVTLVLERLAQGVAASHFGLPSGSDRVIERLTLTIDQRIEVSVFLIEVGYSDVLHRWLVPLPRRWLDLSVKVLDIDRSQPQGILARSMQSTVSVSSNKRDAAATQQQGDDGEGWQEQYREDNDNLFGSANRFSQFHE